MAALENWLTDLSTLQLKDDGDTNFQLALWINLYNALVIHKVLRRYPIRSIRPTILGLPNWLAFFWFFWQPTYHLGDRRLRLSTIEHGILREEFQDPRIHFALVCAAIGCPLLRPEAYQPEIVQNQLKEDAYRFMNNSQKVRYDARSDRLYCSRIFKWYRQDFVAYSRSIQDYVNAYLRSEEQPTINTAIVYLDYDWSLNQ